MSQRREQNRGQSSDRRRGARPTMSALRNLAWLLAAILLPAAHALPDDAEQPIEISADRAEIDDATGTATYFGDVRMKQGSMIVTAETLRIETRNDEVTRIVADGDEELATFEQQLEVTDPDKVLGRAASIVYRTLEERIEFTGDAELAQSTDRFTGEEISYDLRERKVDASGGEERMTFTINPRSVRERSEAPEASTGEGDGPGARPQD